MSDELDQKCRKLIQELKLASSECITAVTALTGGVSSDIACVELDQRCLCVKFALPELKVTALWQAPVQRNRAEYEWLQLAASIAPQSAIKLFGRSEKLHGFVMEYLEGNSVYLWKTALLTEQENRGEARKVGDLIGQLHAGSARASFNPAPFRNRDDFYSLRIEPYLVYTAGKHPDLARPLSTLADNLYHAEQVLVHGDISPKNIFFRECTPIILDAECASMGDAGFDLAFCLNHLILKAAHLPDSRQQLLQAALELWRSYQPHITWEQADDLEARVCQLLPALMLARVDGKSPVEYLNTGTQANIRAVATTLIKAPCSSLQEFNVHFQSELTDLEAKHFTTGDNTHQ